VRLCESLSTLFLFFPFGGVRAMERWEVESIAWEEARDVADSVRKDLGRQISDLQSQIDYIDESNYALREEIADKLEEAVRKLQSNEDVTTVLIQLFREIARLLREFEL